MTYLEQPSHIKRESLSGEHYLQSLLEQAYSAQLLSDSAMEKIQLDCLSLLAKQTERFNNGNSSSIRVENAEKLLESILFTVGVQLKTYQSPDAAMDALQREGVEPLFVEGKKQVDRLLKRSKLRHAALVERLLPSKNVFYASTIVEGIRGFFQLYRPAFHAQEIHITADYPVYNKTERLQGIEFIAQYLEQLYYENAFCIQFSPESIHQLLCGYNEQYPNLLLNLYEPVLTAALGCVITASNEEHLELTQEAQDVLCRQLDGKSQIEIEQMLATAFAELSQKMSCSKGLRSYVKQSLSLLASTIETASRMGTLDRIFLVPSYPENKPKLVVSYGERMTDAGYRKLVEEFFNCESIEDKRDIIQAQIHSLGDLNDLLLDAEPSLEEIPLLLQDRSPVEVAALMKKYRTAYEMSFTELREAEKTLYEGLERLASSLPAEQQRLLEQAVNVSVFE